MHDQFVHLQPALIPFASLIGDFWDDQIVANDRVSIFLVFAGFLGSFLFIRTSARLGRSTTWWPGSVVTDDGLHLHHLVWGICLMMGSGVLAFSLHTEGGWFHLSAALFGIGMGMTIDEFALWIYLKDVYWSNEGRSSIDAALYVTALMGLILIGANPLDGEEGMGAIIVTLAVDLAVSLVCFSKKRISHGLIGLLIPLVSLYGAVRLGKPDSVWAKHFYGERNPQKQERSEKRFTDRRTDAFKHALVNLVGGRTNAQLESEGKAPERVSKSEIDAEQKD